MTDKKFDPKKLKKLNNPERLKIQNPDLIWDTLKLDKVDTIIDVGAGTGFFAMPFADKAKQAKLYACDTSDVMLDWMHDNLPNIYSDRIIPLKSKENSIPLENEIADLVYMINLHHELDAPGALLREVTRLLKTGGKAFVIDWKTEETPAGPPLSIRISVEIIKQQFQEAGLTNIQVYDILPQHSFVVGEKK